MVNKWTEFVQKHYKMVSHLPVKERFKALSKLRGGMLNGDAEVPDVEGSEEAMMAGPRVPQQSLSQVARRIFQDFGDRYGMVANFDLFQPTFAMDLLNDILGLLQRKSKYSKSEMKGHLTHLFQTSAIVLIRPEIISQMTDYLVREIKKE